MTPEDGLRPALNNGHRCNTILRNVYALKILRFGLSHPLFCKARYACVSLVSSHGPTEYGDPNRKNVLIETKYGS